MRLAARVDSNQREIVQALRAVGASVVVTSSVGRGFPDLVVGYDSVNHLFEVKDGSKPASRRRLTDSEKEFHRVWRGTVHIINNTDEALEIIGACYE